MVPHLSKVLPRILGVAASLAVCLVAAWIWNLSRVHKHCIKIAGMGFGSYAEAHEGALPFSTNGFGDAMLLLVKEEHVSGVEFICGPGDDGRILATALAQGLDVPEDECSRVYVQGLKTWFDPELCVLFDRRSVRGGDHLRGYGPRLREVCMLNGSMNKIRDSEWPAFSRKQVELLMAAGWRREAAMAIYPDGGQAP